MKAAFQINAGLQTIFIEAENRNEAKDLSGFANHEKTMIVQYKQDPSYKHPVLLISRRYP